MIVRVALRTLPLLCAVLLLPNCAKKKPTYKSASYTSDRLATIPHGMAREDYPFGDDGRYRKDWVSSGGGRSKKASKPVKSGSKRSSPSPSSDFGPSSNVAASPGPSRPSPSAASAAPAAPKPSARYHTVVKGDTLFGLASKYKVSVGDIKRVNGLSGDLIKLGQSLRIP